MAILKDLLVQGSSRFLSSVTGTSITADSFIKSGGTSSQFLKADGSVDSSTYLNSTNYTSYINTTNFPGLNSTGTITKVGTVTSGEVAVSVTSGGATIGTSATTIATIGGVAVQAKIGSYAASGHTHTKILYVDSRNTAVTPTDAVAINGVQLDFKSASVGGLGSSGYNGVLTLDPYSDVSGGYPIQLGWNTSVDGNNTRDICIRTAKSATEWNSWRVIADRELTTSEIETICV